MRMREWREGMGVWRMERGKDKRAAVCSLFPFFFFIFFTRVRVKKGNGHFGA